MQRGRCEVELKTKKSDLGLPNACDSRSNGFVDHSDHSPNEL
jgi:hypothetical protein